MKSLFHRFVPFFVLIICAQNLAAAGLIQEGEDGQLFGAFEIGIDANASGGQYVHVPNGFGNSNTVINPANRVDYTFDIAQAGLYQVNTSIYAEGSPDNSFFVGLDNDLTAAFRWNIFVNRVYREDAVANNTAGIDPFFFDLSAGIHTLSFYHREDGARLDRLELILIQANDNGGDVVNLFNEALYSQVLVSSSIGIGDEYQATDEILTNGWVASDANPFIDLTFDNPISLSRASIFGLPSLLNQVTSATMSFSLGGSAVSNPIQIGALPNGGEPFDIVVEPTLLVDSIRVSIDSFIGSPGLAELQVFTALPQSQEIIFQDYFNNSNIGASFPTVGAWSQVNECASSGDGRRARWTELSSPIGNGVDNALYQDEACFDTDELNSVITGTYRFINSGLSEFDLRVRLRAEAVNVSTDPFSHGIMGVIFNRTNNNNYYRYEIGRLGGERTLLKKNDGGFTELGNSSLTYPLDEWVNIRIVRQNGVIVVFQDGEQVLSVADASENGTGVGLFCAKNSGCLYDNLIMLAPSPLPILGLVSPIEFSVAGGNAIDIEAVVTVNSSQVGGVEFAIDEGLPSEVILRDVDGLPPYSQSIVFDSLSVNHTIHAYALDSVGIERLANIEARDESLAIGVNGISLLVYGDSISEGLFDNVSSDDLANVGLNAGRVDSSGYDPLLLDLLSGDNSDLTVSVLSDAYAGEATASSATRLPTALARQPGVDLLLFMIGTNDLAADRSLPSGQGATVNTTSPSTYKDYLQIVIDDVLSRGIKIMLASPLAQFNNPAQVVRGSEFRSVISELITENANVNVMQGPDLFQRFTADEASGVNFPSLLADELHPTGNGYQEMANLWCQFLNGVLVENITFSCSP